MSDVRPPVSTALMLLSNAFDADPRVYSEARALVEAGLRVVIVAWDRDRKCPAREVVDGIEVVRVFPRSTHGRGVGQALVMPRVLASMVAAGLGVRFDSVQAHDFDTLPAAYVLSRLKRKPLLYDSHEDYAGMLHGNIPARLESLIRHVEAWLVRRTDVVLTVGETLRQEFVRRGARQCVVVGNWKNLSEFRLPGEVRAAVRAELGIPSDALVIGFIANLGRERYIAELLEAVHCRPSVHLIIGGNGPMAELAYAAAQEFPNIHYLGFVPPRQVSRFTAATDVSYYAFNTSSPNAVYSAPNKLFEALAAGCALLSGHFGEIGKIVEQEQCGVLVPDFSVASIVAALDECRCGGLLSAWKERAARAGAERYNWEEARKKLLRVYQDVLQTPVAASPESELGKAVLP